MLQYADSLDLSQNASKQCNFVDVMKFALSLLVVSIHIPPLVSYSYALDFLLRQCLARVAVPFFFVASGYFLFRKTDPNNFNKKITLGYAGRILRLYAIWTILYLPIILLKAVAAPQGVRYGMLQAIRNILFVGSYWQLWYLHALVAATLILTLLLAKKVKLKYILATAAVLYLIGLLGQAYYGLVEGCSLINRVYGWYRYLFDTTRNGIFFGFPLMVMGMLFAYKPIKLSCRWAVIGLVCSLLLLVAEALFIRYLGWAEGTDMYLSLIPVAFFLFYLAAHIQPKDSKIYGYLRKMSGLIFYLHLLVCWAMEMGLAMFSVRITNSLLMYTLTVVLTMAVSHCIIILSKKVKWLKYLYA